MSYFNERKSLTKKDILEGVENITSSRFIGNNTVEYYVENDRYIRLHHTDILVFSGDCVRISSGGWRSITTKDRINKYLPSGYSLQSDGGFWFICHDGKRFPFKDGMVIDLKKDVSDSGDYEKAHKQFKLDKKKITVYIDKYSNLLLSGKMTLPGAGDCLICQIAAQNPDYVNYDHIQSHIDEFYFVPALIWAACKGTKNEYYLNYVKALQSGQESYLSKRDIKHILRKYFTIQKRG